ncbi:enoyl-CoA hydratase/isomerase family protein [Novosphingobium rosa]|uniref:enoyl-CoA hydratase/isomerase family protein n=1 Tax=Novosphingobium rosa TaxID=76978 RepID=UPI000831510E|nr:enoyl-CoA hydratase-related protein [Novosphingobium rosa]
MSDQTVLLRRDGPVAVLTLNRPDAGNTVNMPLALALEQAVDDVLADPALRCVVLTGAGKLFCGGGDIASFAQAADASAFLFDLASALHRSVSKLAHGGKPLVTLINGPAAGAGLSLALLGDIVLASASAHFTAAYGLVGLTPDGGMSWLLPRLVGLRRAQEIILTNRRIGAQEAQAIGLVTRVVDAEALLEEGMALAHTLATGPTAALGGARDLLAAGFQNDLDSHLALEASRIARAGASDEAREGIAAFLTRRKPQFTERTPS